MGQGMWKSESKHYLNMPFAFQTLDNDHFLPITSHIRHSISITSFSSIDSYNQHIALIQPLLKLSVKRDRRRTPTVRRHFNAQYRTIGEQHLSKRQRVWADRRHEDARSKRVHHRPSRTHGIGGRTRGRGNDQSVRMDGGQEGGVNVTVQLNHAGGSASVNHDVVQYLQFGLCAYDIAREIVDGETPSRCFFGRVFSNNAVFQSTANG